MDSPVAVVIPYFQREPGILARALRSIFQQRDVARPRVIVVDDESPVSAESELASFGGGVGDTVTVIRRANGGPARARNTGLAAVPDDVEWIALMDSDDIWCDNHLSVALGALGQGFDIFFADHLRVGDEESQFESCRFDLSGCRPIDAPNAVFAYEGDLFGPVLRQSPVGMSTLVMRRSAMGNLRFSTKLRLCDDLLFALDLAYKAPRVCVSSKIHVSYGKGLNISLVEWNSNAALRWKLDFSLFFSEIRRRYRLTPEQSRILKSKIRENRQAFLYAAFGILRRGDKLDIASASRFVARDPMVISALPALARREFLARAS